MPRLTKQQLEEVRYVSLDDFIYRINQISNIDDKVAFATRYLLDYGHNENPDVPFYQALYVARAKIADASYDLKETFNEDEEIDKGEYLGDIVNVLNPYATDESYDRQGTTFMAHPIEYLKAHAMKLAEEIDEKDFEFHDDIVKKEYYIQIAAELSDKDGAEKFEEFEKDHIVMGIDYRMREKYNGKLALNNAISSTKSNFFTKLFDSKEYVALQKAEKNYKDPNHEDYGNTEELETAAALYLKHKFPNWDPQTGYPKEEAINAYSGKAKARIVYAINLVKCLHDVREKDQDFNRLKYHNRNIDFKVENAFMPEPQNDKAIDQSLFQEDLDNKLNKENENKNDLENENEEDIFEPEIEILNNKK
jgi:hypothetical protein